MDLAQQRKRLISEFSEKKKKYFLLGLVLIFIFLLIIDLGPLKELEQFGLLGLKKIKEQLSLAAPAIEIGTPAGPAYNVAPPPTEEGIKIASAQGAPSPLDDEERNFLVLINQYRSQNNLPALQISLTLTNAAEWMANDMATDNYLPDENFCAQFGLKEHCDNTPRAWTQRLSDFGYTYNTFTGENLAAGCETAAICFDTWKNSPDHNKGMLTQEFLVIGIGRAYNVNSTHGWYWATDFGGYIDTSPPDSDPSAYPSSYYAASYFEGQDLDYLDPYKKLLAYNKNDSNSSNILLKRWGEGEEIDATGQSDHVSARWRGNFYFEKGTYAFYIQQVDDGVKLWVNHQLLFEKWDQGLAYTLVAGQYEFPSTGEYPIKIDWYEDSGSASIAVTWVRMGETLPKASLKIWPNPTASGGATNVQVTEQGGNDAAVLYAYSVPTGWQANICQTHPCDKTWQSNFSDGQHWILGAVCSYSRGCSWSNPSSVSIHVGGSPDEQIRDNGKSLPPFLNRIATSCSASNTVQANLSWNGDKVTGETNFEVQKDSGGGFSTIGTLSRDTTSNTSNLSLQTVGANSIRFRIKANFPDGSYSYSHEEYVSATDCITTSATSSPLTVTTYCTGNEHVGIFSPWAKLEWNAKSGYTDQYKAQYRKSGGSWITKLTGGTELYSTDALENNSTYEFKVLLANDSLWAGPVSKSIGCTLSKPQPGSGKPQVSNQYCLGSSVNVRLTWNEYKYVGNPNPTYRVYMKYPGDSAFGYVGATTALAFSTTKGYGNRSLRDNTEIAWQVNVNSSPSDVWWGDTPYTRTPICKSDIVAESLQILPVDGGSTIEPGEAVEGVVWLKNNSSIPAIVGNTGNFKVRLWADRAAQPTVGLSDYTAQTGTTLNAYEGKQIRIPFTAPNTVGSKKAWVLADANCNPYPECLSDPNYIGQVRELNESNNAKSFSYNITLPDVDNDGKRDTEDNCIYTYNPDQANHDNDQFGDSCDDDDDNDGFIDGVEFYIGTDLLDACPDNSSDSAWPLDINNDGVITTVGDVTVYTGRLFAKEGDANYSRRLDLNADGWLTQVGDVTMFTGKLFATCQ